jgi:hypothetical protein
MNDWVSGPVLALQVFRLHDRKVGTKKFKKKQYKKPRRHLEGK